MFEYTDGQERLKLNFPSPGFGVTHFRKGDSQDTGLNRSFDAQVYIINHTNALNSASTHTEMANKNYVHCQHA